MFRLFRFEPFWVKEDYEKVVEEAWGKRIGGNDEVNVFYLVQVAMNQCREGWASGIRIGLVGGKNNLRRRRHD